MMNRRKRGEIDERLKMLATILKLDSVPVMLQNQTSRKIYNDVRRKP